MRPIQKAENAAPKQRGRPFAKGVSGNPAGKPKGTRHRATQAVELLLAGQLEAITRKCIERAIEGDATALRLCLDRLAPPPRERAVRVPLKASTAREIQAAMERISEAVGEGELTPAEGQRLAGMLDLQRRVLDSVELEERVRRLETGLARKGDS
jgi:hypothetical protein